MDQLGVVVIFCKDEVNEETCLRGDERLKQDGKNWGDFKTIIDFHPS